MLWAVKWDEICVCLYVLFHFTFLILHPTFQFLISNNKNRNWSLASARISLSIVFNLTHAQNRRFNPTVQLFTPSANVCVEKSSHLSEILCLVQWDSIQTGRLLLLCKYTIKIMRDGLGLWDLTSQLTAWKVEWFFPHKKALVLRLVGFYL